MTNPKSEHKVRKPALAPQSASRRDAAPAPERKTGANTAMIEACDRLGQKLDEVAATVREQIETWKQTREPAVPRPAPPATAASQPADGRATERAGSVEDTPPRPQPVRPAGVSESQPQSMQPLVDAFARSGAGWQQQSASLQQSIEAIMDFLETQAAAAPPPVDAAAIISRLKTLEEQQKDLQTQFNSSR